MDKTIFKFELETTGMQKVVMPIDAEILTVQVQNDVPCLWALVDAHNGGVTEERSIEIFGTGNPVPQGMGVDRKYLATYQLRGGDFVGHVFERTN